MGYVEGGERRGLIDTDSLIHSLFLEDDRSIM